MKVSVALATYNGSRYLQAQLASFAAQRWLPDELVVCDDASTDDSVNIVTRFKATAPFDVSLYINKNNVGYTRNFEKALSLCRGDLIFLSDQDDVWDASKISIVTSAFIEKSNVHVIINDATYVDANLNSAGITVLQKVVGLGGSESLHIQGSCTAITAEFRDFVVPFPIQHCPVHDAYLHRWARLLRVRRVLPDSLQVWRIHGGNTSATVFTKLTKSSIYDLYKSFVRVDPTSKYMEQTAEFEEMAGFLISRRRELELICNEAVRRSAQKQIAGFVKAQKNRTRLIALGSFSRKAFAIRMMLSGQYKYFYGFRSFMKDVLR